MSSPESLAEHSAGSEGFSELLYNISKGFRIAEGADNSMLSADRTQTFIIPGGPGGPGGPMSP